MSARADNPLARLIAFCARHEMDADARWLEAALWRHVHGEGSLDRCLGITRHGPPWRETLRQERRDQLLCDLYRTHFRALSLHGASWKLAADWASFRRCVWPRIVLSTSMPAAYAGTKLATYYRLMHEGHELIGPRQMFNILRKMILVPVSAEADAVSGDGDRSNSAGAAANRTADQAPQAARTHRAG